MTSSRTLIKFSLGYLTESVISVKLTEAVMVVPVGQVQAAQGPAVLHAEETCASDSTEVGEVGSGMDSRGKL